MKNRGTILALTLMFVPLALILAITVAHSITFGSGYALQSQQRAKAFYLAESGINIAYRLMQADNFSSDTHGSDGAARDDADPKLLIDTGDSFGLERDSEGWYVWEWEPGDPWEDSYTFSGVTERFRFQIVRPSAGTFEITCQARVGRLNETHVLEGEISSMQDLVMYDNGDLADFTGSYNQSFSGDIHANGDVYLRPFETPGLLGAFETTTNPTLVLTTNSLTSGGKIIRHVDPWGHADDGGTVEIVNTSTGDSALLEGYEQGFVGPGNAYDSLHSDWGEAETNPNSAHSRWKGAVADRSMGAQTKSTVLRETFLPGGYYSRHAGLTIDSSTTAPWVEEVEFYNESEERLVKVKEIDVAALGASGAWPDNGLLYSEGPIRLVNAAEFASDLTVASASTVYLKGDFNKKFPTEASAQAGVPVHKKVSVATPDRIYSLTSSFEDKTVSDPTSLLELIAGDGKASDPPLHALDENNVLEMNGAFVDGVPTTDARSWIDHPDNPHYVPVNGVLGIERKVKQVSFQGGVLKIAYAQSSSYLENLQTVRIVGTGSFGHMRNAKMADFENDEASETVTPWLEHTYYVPPRQNVDGKPGMEFEYDPHLASVNGMSEVPHNLKLGRRVRWYRK
ncbi:MAG: pilus assembly PilX N-terminal domain-containing protein [Vulcanimicrobiota bacterium]